MRWFPLAFVLLLAISPSRVSSEVISTWTLENERVAAIHTWGADGAFRLASVTDKRTGKTWAASATTPAALIRLGTGNLQLDSQTAYALVTSEISNNDKGVRRLEVVLRPDGADVEVTFAAEVYPGQPFVRQWYRLRNLSSAALALTSASFLEASFADDGHLFRSFHVNQWVDGGRAGNFETFQTDLASLDSPLVISSGSYAQHCSWVAVQDARESGLVVGWEFNGRADVSIEHDRDNGSLNFRGDILGLNQRVGPGQSFESPAVFWGSFKGDWDEAGYRTQRFVESVLSASLPDQQRFPYVIWDSWGYRDKINEALLRRAADVAARLGVEVFTVDMGWARALGDWYPDPVKFPSGLRALSDYLHARGMKFGLHFPLLQAAPGSPVREQHPDWTTSTSNDFFGSATLCPGHQPARQWIIAEALRLIRDYNVDWVLQDGGDLVQECTRSGHTHNRRNSNYANAVRGIDEIVAAVRREAPATAWENCESGGRMMTYQMVRNYATSIASDDTDELTTRQAIYGATFPFPPRYADRYMGLGTVSKFALRSGMFAGGPWVLMGRLADWRESDISLAAHEVAVYKSLRLLARDGKVFHLSGRPDGVHNEVVESNNRRLNAAVIFVFRNQSGAARERVLPRGLVPDAEYRVRLEEAGTVVVTTGRDLMENGIEVPLPTPNYAEIIYINPQPVP